MSNLYSPTRHNHTSICLSAFGWFSGDGFNQRRNGTSSESQEMEIENVRRETSCTQSRLLDWERGLGDGKPQLYMYSCLWQHWRGEIDIDQSRFWRFWYCWNREFLRRSSPSILAYLRCRRRVLIERSSRCTRRDNPQRSARSLCTTGVVLKLVMNHRYRLSRVPWRERQHEPKSKIVYMWSGKFVSVYVATF